MIRLAAGINDLTNFTTSPCGKRVLQRSSVQPVDLIETFKTFEETIRERHPTLILSITTIPPASFAAFQACRELHTPILSQERLSTDQQDLNNTVDAVNAFITNHSKQFQQGVIPRTLCWHRDVRKATKRRHKNGKIAKTILRNNFTHLYDGLHAKTYLKQRWFKELLRAFSSDVRALS